VVSRVATLHVEVEEEHVVDVPADVAAAHFADLAAVAAAAVDAERTDVLGPGLLRWTLVRHEALGVVHQGVYTARYVRDGTTVRWTTEGEGNMRSQGSAVFAPTAGGATLRYRHVLDIELPVGRLVLLALQPVAVPIARRGVAAWVRNMIATLPRSA
jgi:hypothetical protein